MVTVEKIKQVGIKPKLGESTLIKRVFFRKYSYHFSWFFIKLGMTGNQVSAFGLIFGMISCLFFVTNNYLLFIVGSVFLLISIISDFADGNVARYRKYKDLPDEPFRKYGGFIDSLLNFPRIFVIICLSISFIYYYHPLLILTIGFISAMFCFLDIGLNGLLYAVFKKRLTYRNSKIAKKIRVISYDQATLPLFLFATSFIDIFTEWKLTFYYWLYMAFAGCILFILELYGVRKNGNCTYTNTM